MVVESKPSCQYNQMFHLFAQIWSGDSRAPTLCRRQYQLEPDVHQWHSVHTFSLFLLALKERLLPVVSPVLT